MILLLGTLPVLGHEVLTLSCGSSPKSVEVYGHRAYVQNLESGSVTIYDARSFKKIGSLEFARTPATGWDYKTQTPIPSFAEKPVEALLTHGGRYSWFSLHNDAAVVVYQTMGRGFKSEGGQTRTAQLKTSDGRQLVKTLLRIPVQKTPKVMVASRMDHRVAVSNWHSHSVSLIDGRRFKLEKNVKVSDVPRGLAFSLDGRTLYVAIMYGSYLEVIDTEKGLVTGRITGVGKAPRDLARDRDGRYLYVSANQSNTVCRVDLKSGRVVATVKVGRRPRSLCIDPEQRSLYVCCFDDDQVYEIGLKDFKVARKLATGDMPVGLDVAANGDLWIANQGDSTVTVHRLSRE